MRYIHKSRNSQVRTFLNKACRNLRKSGVKVIYDNFNDKKNLIIFFVLNKRIFVVTVKDV